ncbi:Eukaryotic/viral aspartic protease [Phytophthora megakarya]|uniref:Eukaryotic/viral aspartic protease n=1 Tax=Phytophthora megakarya TaxID=4795 RepID=A0A225X1T7_9STRA|nr:Eukaryotic/viral aspartic protease [Phytophthora megakarya]
MLQFDTGTEVSMVDPTFAREEHVGIRDATYFTVGKTCVNVTLAGNMVYYIDLWVGDLVGQNVIFGIYRGRPLYGSKMRPVKLPSLCRVAAGQTFDVLLRPEKNAPRL